MGTFRQFRRRQSIQQRWSRLVPAILQTTDITSPIPPDNYFPDNYYVDLYNIVYNIYYHAPDPNAIKISTDTTLDFLRPAPTIDDDQENPETQPLFIAEIQDSILEKTGDVDVNVITIQVASMSSGEEARVWTEDNAFLTVSKNGHVEYNPRGRTYLWDVVDLKLSIGDNLHVASPRVREQGTLYQLQIEDDHIRLQRRQRELRSEINIELTRLQAVLDENRRQQILEKIHGLQQELRAINAELGEEGVPILTEFVEVEGDDPEVRTFKLVVKEDVIGDPEAADRFWQDQLNDGTCLIVALASALAAQGITDEDGNPLTYEKVYDDYVAIYEREWRVVDGREIVVGIRLVKDANIKTPVQLNAFGEPLPNLAPPGVYYARVDDVYYSSENPNEIVRTVQGETWPSSHEHELEGVPFRDLAGDFRGSSTAIARSVIGNYGGKLRRGYASDFTTLLAELDAGNPVIAAIDGYELWGDPEVLSDPQSHVDRQVPGAFSEVNHALWITGVDRSDPDNPRIIVNDSAGEGPSESYSLLQFLAAWEDSNFLYFTTNDRPLIPGSEDFDKQQKIKQTQENEARHNYLRMTYRDALFKEDSTLLPVIEKYFGEDAEAGLITPEQLLALPKVQRSEVIVEIIKTDPQFFRTFREWAETLENLQKEVEVDWGINLENVKNIIDEVDFPDG